MPTQYVQVKISDTNSRSYAYRWHGNATDQRPLNIGDRVLLPANVITPEPFWGTVVAFGSEGYTGPMAEVIERG